MKEKQGLYCTVIGRHPSTLFVKDMGTELLSLEIGCGPMAASALSKIECLLDRGGAVSARGKLRPLRWAETALRKVESLRLNCRSKGEHMAPVRWHPSGETMDGQATPRRSDSGADGAVSRARERRRGAAGALLSEGTYICNVHERGPDIGAYYPLLRSAPFLNFQKRRSMIPHDVCGQHVSCQEISCWKNIAE